MQPEDIIQQKEWPQLTAEERSVVEPLAVNEQEYNLLKRMLEVAADDAGEVPVIDPAVKTRIKRSSGKQNIFYFTKKWQYAAAIAVLAAAGAWFILQTRDTGKKIVKKEDATQQPLPPKTEEKPFSPTAEKRRQEQVTTGAPVQKKKDIPLSYPVTQQKDEPEKNDTVRQVQDDTPAAGTMAFNTSVGNNTALLGLLTEVYE